VAAFERAKLRLLNGAHSTLAYVGLGRGHESVSQAMADPRLASFVERLMRQDIAASLASTRGLDVDVYVGQILARFRNPAIVHRLSQIAWDGSQKLPIRLLDTIADALAAGRPVERLVVGVAAWMQFIRRQAHADSAITDPLAETLTARGQVCTGEPAHDVGVFLSLTAVFPPRLVSDPALRTALETAYGQLGGGQPDLALHT
jgi:fructuronate reductase